LFIPEGSVKIGFRRAALKFYPGIPNEFMVNRGDIVVQVGSPVPSRLERLSRSVGKKGKVVFIEPDVTNLEKQWENVERKNLKNVIIVPKAAYKQKGTAKFLIAPRPADHRLVIENIEHDNDYRAENYYLREVDVEVDTIDNILADLQIGRIDYIEIAINGAELVVIQGMERILNFTRRLFVKGHARDKESKRPLNQELVPILTEKGFATYLTKPSASVAKTINWGPRAGDIYAWKIR
jgi:FkbM family methyltransferase